MLGNRLKFYVHDLDGALDWYRRELAAEPRTATRNRVVFLVDGVQLDIIRVSPPRSNFSYGRFAADFRDKITCRLAAAYA